MSWVVRAEASVDTAINTTRLLRPSAAANAEHPVNTRGVLTSPEKAGFLPYLPDGRRALAAEHSEQGPRALNAFPNMGGTHRRVRRQ